MSIGDVLLDLSLALAYSFANPFRISRKFLQRKGEREIYAYGETPLTTWSAIAKQAHITPHDTLLDLGCGRGCLCFWSETHLGCQTIGVDWIPRFTRTAQFLAKIFSRRATFICATFDSAPIPQATVIYLYSYFHDEEKLIEQLKQTTARIITVSEPLPSNQFESHCLGTFSFPWGATEVYLNRVSPPK